MPHGIVTDYSTVFYNYKTYLDNTIQVISVEGTSMAPAFKTGDTLLWVPASIENLQVGEIALWKTLAGGTYYAHRVVQLAQHSLLTQGDNNPAPDPWVWENQVRGQIIGALFTSSEGWHG